MNAITERTTDARGLALDLVQSVLRRGRPLDQALSSHPARDRLERRDRAFARLVAATTLRRLGQIDDLVRHFVPKALPPQAARAEDALRIGLAQLLFLGTAPHAAVDRSVALVPQKMKGLVNAVLRRAGREGAAIIAAQDAARLALPDWLWRRWTDAYGEETVRAIVACQLADPPLDVTLKPGLDAAVWAERLEAELLPTGSLRRRSGGPVEDMPGFRDGAWWVQDAAAALPARLLGAVDGLRVVDLAAAPGGKTAQLAAAGAQVTAVDVAEQRLSLVQANLDRLGLSAECVAADGRSWRPPEPVDAVLIDVPCTATGTIRRHPDVPWLKRPEDAAQLLAVQDRLTVAALEMVRPGGLVVYACCSLDPGEGPERIAAVMARDPQVERVPVTPDEVPGLAEAITPEGDLRTLPSQWAGQGGLDGFYIARLRRR